MKDDFKTSFKKDFKKNRWLILAVLAGSVVLLIRTGWQQHQLTTTFEQACEAEMGMDIRGVVTKASFDNSQPSQFHIDFSNGKSYQPIDSKSWKSIALTPGDSIRKMPGSFAVSIYRATGPPLRINDSMDCQGLIEALRKNK